MTKWSTDWWHYKEVEKSMQKKKNAEEHLGNTFSPPYMTYVHQANDKKKHLFYYIKSLCTDYCILGTSHKNGTS